MYSQHVRCAPMTDRDCSMRESSDGTQLLSAVQSESRNVVERLHDLRLWNYSVFLESRARRAPLLVPFAVVFQNMTRVGVELEFDPERGFVQLLVLWFLFCDLSVFSVSDRHSARENIPLARITSIL